MAERPTSFLGGVSRGSGDFLMTDRANFKFSLRFIKFQSPIHRFQILVAVEWLYFMQRALD
jgi:hypothetical protein